MINHLSQLNKLKDQKVISIDGRRLFKPVHDGVQHKIGRDSIEDYLIMAELLNQSSVNVVNIQHEFGIFGGEFGEYICAFMDKLKKPIATTLHTVLPNFEPKAREVFDRIVALSSAVIVLNKTTRALVESYGVDPEKNKVDPSRLPRYSSCSKLKSQTPPGVARQGCDVFFWSFKQGQRNRIRY